MPDDQSAARTRLMVLGRVNAVLVAQAGLSARAIYDAVLTEVPAAAQCFPRPALWQWAHVASTHRRPARTPGSGARPRSRVYPDRA